MKKYYKKPDIKDIVPGKIVPIYVNFKEEKDLAGFAMINHRTKSLQEELPYVRAEIGGKNGKYQSQSVLWIHKRFNITFVDPLDYDPTMSFEKRMKYIHQKGFTTNWNIAFFLKTSSNIYINKKQNNI